MNEVPAARASPFLVFLQDSSWAFGISTEDHVPYSFLCPTPGSDPTSSWI